MAPLDAMTIRLHLRATPGPGGVEDLPEALVVAVVAMSSLIRCGRCGARTNRVHATEARVLLVCSGHPPPVTGARRSRARPCHHGHDRFRRPAPPDFAKNIVYSMDCC